MEQVSQEKVSKENSNCFIDLATIIAMVAEEIKSTEDEHWLFNQAWYHPYPK